MTDKNIYQTIYGCVVKREIKDSTYSRIKNYVGYLCGMSVWANGGSDDFSISFDLRNFPDWVDNRGVIHLREDAWMQRIEKKCMKKMNLSYTIIQTEIDKEVYNGYVNKADLIIDENIFYDYGDNDLPF